MTTHPTFHELRDGERYLIAGGGIVTAHEPFLPGQAIFTTMPDGTPYYCSTRSLHVLPRWRVGLRFNDGGDGLAYITAEDEDAAAEIALRMLDVLRVTTITQEAS